jgi:acyl-CoA synthetase (AMP-forming)/AMP-acid ligase II
MEAAWTRWADRPAIYSGGCRTTYAQLGNAATSLAGAYRRLGIAPGDRVVCSMSNRPEHLVALCGAWLCGTVHVGADHKLTAPELAEVVRLTQASVLVYEPPDDAQNPLGVVATLRDTHPRLRIVVVTDGAVPDDCLTLSHLIGDVDNRLERLSGPSPDDPAVVFITSGTTGTPKATTGFHQNLEQRWRRLGRWLTFGTDDVHLAQLPLSHGFGLMMAISALLAGGSLVVMNRFSGEEALELVAADRVTVLNGAPAHFKLLMQHLDPARHDVRSLRLSVGTAAPFPPALVMSIWESLGVQFMFMYGSSEGIGVATTDRDTILAGSVGSPEPGSVTIVGPDHRPLPLGEVGEIAFSRAVFPVRYWSGPGPEPLAPVDSRNGWYYSGDLGRLDGDGRLYVFGRLKHQIDRGGLKIDPVEVEAAVLRCPDVADAAIIGVSNPALGETVCACVAPQPGHAPTLEQLRTALSETLAPYKLPEQLCILDQIPRTQIGKVDLPRLRSEVEAAAASQRPMRR